MWGTVANSKRFSNMAKSAGRATRKRTRHRKRESAPKRWSSSVTKHSDALDLDKGVFTWKDPARIAASLKRSAQASSRRKVDPYRSALSMLTFYINRAGANLPKARKSVLQQAKGELRKAFGRD